MLEEIHNIRQMDEDYAFLYLNDRCQDLYYKNKQWLFEGLTQLQPSDSFGEMALEQSGTRSASIFAKTQKVVLASLDNENFKKFNRSEIKTVHEKVLHSSFYAYTLLADFFHGDLQ